MLGGTKRQAEKAIEVAQSAHLAATAAATAAKTATDFMAGLATASQRALELGAENKAKHEGHEMLCAQRQNQILKSLGGLWWVVLISAGTLIVSMAGLVVSLLFHGVKAL